MFSGRLVSTWPSGAPWLAAHLDRYASKETALADMSKPAFLKSIVKIAEDAGGFLLPADPPTDVRGWVAVATLAPKANIIDTDHPEFLFVDQESAQEFVNALIPLMDRETSGEHVIVSALFKSSDAYFFCSICGARRRDVSHLLQGLKGAICSRCIKTYAEELDSLEKDQDA